MLEVINRFNLDRVVEILYRCRKTLEGKALLVEIERIGDRPPVMDDDVMFFIGAGAPVRAVTDLLDQCHRCFAVIDAELGL